MRADYQTWVNCPACPRPTPSLTPGAVGAPRDTRLKWLGRARQYVCGVCRRAWTPEELDVEMTRERARRLLAPEGESA